MVSKKDETTTRLMDILQNVNSTNSFDYYKRSHLDNITYSSFGDYLKDQLEISGNITLSEAIKNSNLDRTYAYQIVSGNKQNPSRDKILSLCLGAHFDLNQTKHALEIAGLAPLYPKNSRDAAIIICINTGKFNIVDVNIFLEKNNLPIL
jgi:hypothetical protein